MSLRKLFLVVVALELSKNKRTCFVNTLWLGVCGIIEDKRINVVEHTCLLVHALVIELDSESHCVELISTCLTIHAAHT